MINHPATPVEDDYANARLRGQITRGNARRGYFYRNIGEDEGSISAAVPSAAHLERLDRQQHEGLLAHFGAWDPLIPLYHGSLDKFEKGTVITPEGRNPGYSIHGGDYVHATTSPENARYFGSMHDFSSLTDTPVHVHRVEPVGDIEPYNMPGEDERFAHGNYRAKAFRVTETDSNPAPRIFTAVAESEAFPNPYHGTARFGGRPEFSRTWFHGTKGVPEFGERKGHGDLERMKLPPGERMKGMGWPQPNQMMGVHFSPLHEVAHKFVGSVSSQPGALVHARLGFRNPAHYPTERHLNYAVAHWASQHYPHWHDEKLNDQLRWNYSNQEGTHHDFSRVPGETTYGDRAQDVLQWHPHLPEIIQGFHEHLRSQGHRGITYGNGVEGPYDTDATRGGEASMKYMEKTRDWPSGSPKHISAIAQPDDIETTHVEHVAPWREQPQPHERTWEDISDGDEPDAMRDRVLAYHRFHGGAYPREERTAAKQAQAEEGYVDCDQGHTHWGRHGAAFLLLRHTDDEGTKRYLLQKRTSTGATDHPGTWALPGGALHAGEDSYAGARREAAEEMGLLPRIKHHHTVHDDHGGWFADTHIADARDKFAPKGGGSTGFEAEGHAWFKQDEISRLRLHPGFAKTWDTVRRSQVDKTAAYEADDKSRVYLRFGDWHHSETSRNYVTGHPEYGVSVYDLDHRGHPEDPDANLGREHRHDEHCEPDCDLDQWDEEYGNDTGDEMRRRVEGAERARYRGEDERAEAGHLVRGDMVGIGHDGEPLLKRVRRVGDWIDHRHLFIPGAERHRLARDPHDEDYEPPEERPPLDKHACLTCGCDEPHNRHGDDRNITIEDLQGAAGWADISVDKAVKNLDHTVTHEKGHKTAALDVHDYAGTVGNNGHITRNEYGHIPTSAIAHMPGARGEVPGEHRNMDDEDEWPEFKRDIAANGIRDPVFITVNHGEEPRMSEGNHRRDAAVELNLPSVPAEIRYFGHAEQQGTVLERHGRHTAVITPGSLPPAQQEAFDDPDDRIHRRKMFEVAKHPEPGTRVWRGEIRRNDEDPETAESVGMHWSASPDPIITGWAPEGHKHVVWQGVVEHHGEQAFPRGHPIWSGRHQSFDHEAEVRFRPGTQVKLEGAYVHQPKEYPGGMAQSPGYLVPRIPERTHPDWHWHPLDRHVTIRHRGRGAADYSDVGIERESAAMVP
jgi:8-oxo-dGTP pyrophosphatase MutT (NUDIX family)